MCKRKEREKKEETGEREEKVVGAYACRFDNSSIMARVSMSMGNFMSL